jgi:hypothetical protein
MLYERLRFNGPTLVFVKQQPRQMTLPGSNTRECQEHFSLQRLSQSSANLQRSKMDPTAAITLVINNTRVVAHFITNLAITLIQRCAAEVLGLPIRPVFGPDTTFTDPTTSRVFTIQGETRLALHYANQQESVTAYVVHENEISKSILLGMDALLALQGRLVNYDGDEQMNPIFPIPGENRLLTPRPIFATSLTASLASLSWQQQSPYTMEPYHRQYHQDTVTNTTFPILGQIQLPVGTQGDRFSVLITNINTPFMFGLDYLRKFGFRIEFPGFTINWPRTLAVRPLRRRAVAIRGPTCPRCRQSGHLRSQCTGRPRPAERSSGARVVATRTRP